MIRRLMFFSTLAVLCASASLALAHGPQVQVTVSQNKLATGLIFFDEPYSTTPTDPKSVYVMPVLDFNGQWYSRPNTALAGPLPAYFSGPGINYGLASPNLTAGSTITMTFTDELKRWNGSAFVGGAAVTEQIQAFSGSNYAAAPSPTFFTATTTDTGPFASILFATTAGSDTFVSHSTRRFRLAGSSGDPSDGVYLLGMQLSTNSSGISDSDPYYFVLNKNADATTVDAAVASLGVPPSAVQVIPEPSAILLGVLGIPLAYWSYRRRVRS